MIIVAELNARLGPIDRGGAFEDPLDAVLAGRKLGQVTGGGSVLNENGEVAQCDVEIELTEAVAGESETTFALVIQTLEELNAPKGSRLVVSESRSIPFGQCEGMAIYLNATELPDEVYQESDVSEVAAELERSLAGAGKFLGAWHGVTESALYFYGSSFAQMSAASRGTRAQIPLCEQSRVEQIV